METLSSLLRADSAAFHQASIGYAAMFEVALKLYEPPLRELAPRHLHDHAEAAASINQLIAGAVARELAEVGLECRCICPMCSIGACGCVSFATETLTASWRETLSARDETPGFPLQAPKPDSQLALAGVLGGDRLLRVDDQPVRSVGDIQAAIRRHPLGGELRLSVKQEPSEPRELRVRHVSDYLPG
jgi:hypothetical protein